MIVILCNTNSNDKNCHGHFSKSNSKEQTPEVSGPFTRSSASVRPPPPSPGLCRRRSTSRAWSWAQSPGVRLGIPWHIRNIEDLRVLGDHQWSSSHSWTSFVWDAMRWDCSRGFKPIHRFLKTFDRENRGLKRQKVRCPSFGHTQMVNSTFKLS